MELQKALDIVRGLADESLAESWDQVGLQVGDSAWEVDKAMLCIDLTEAVVSEAVKRGVNLIVAYHPPLFKPVSRLTDGDWKQRAILMAAMNRIAVYSPHTALDAVADGVNDWLAEGLVLKGEDAKVSVICPANQGGNVTYKVVTFVPAESLDKVRGAMAAAGAGVIGDYSNCSFAADGVGTFLGGATSNPAVGQKGKLESVDEKRVEMIVGGAVLGSVIEALRSAHPYEEPAFDVYRLEDVGGADNDGDVTEGQGRVVELSKGISVDELAGRVRKLLGVVHLEIAAAGGGKRIRRIGLCAGAGGSLMADAGEIDAFFTGEMRHHDILDARQRGVILILAGHTQTERPYLKVLRKRLMKAGGKGLVWLVSRSDVAASEMV